MSRGPGEVERHVLGQLEELGERDGFPLRLTTSELAQSWAGSKGMEPTRSHRKSVWRAVRKLEARGLIEVETVPILWVGGGEQLEVALAFTEAQWERSRREMPAILEKLRAAA